MAGLVTVRLGDWAASNAGFRQDGMPTDPWGNRWQLQKLSGWTGRPASRSSKTARYGDGNWRGEPRLQSRTITASGVVRCVSDAAGLAARDWFMAQLPGGDDPATDSLYVPFSVEETARGLTRQALVAQDGEWLCDWYGQDHMQWSIVMDAPDPLIYNATASVLSTAPYAPSVGAGWPWVWPVVWGVGGAGSSGNVLAVNNGSRGVWPVVTFYGPSLNPMVRIEGGDYVQVLMSIAAGDQPVVVDFGEPSVTQGGWSRRAYAAGDWFRIPPGSSRLQYTTDSGTGAAEVAFRETWI